MRSIGSFFWVLLALILPATSHAQSGAPLSPILHWPDFGAEVTSWYHLDAVPSDRALILTDVELKWIDDKTFPHEPGGICRQVQFKLTPTQVLQALSGKGYPERVPSILFERKGREPREFEGFIRESSPIPAIGEKASYIAIPFTGDEDDFQGLLLEPIPREFAMLLKTMDFDVTLKPIEVPAKQQESLHEFKGYEFSIEYRIGKSDKKRLIPFEQLWRWQKNRVMQIILGQIHSYRSKAEPAMPVRVQDNFYSGYHPNFLNTKAKGLLGTARDLVYPGKQGEKIIEGIQTLNTEIDDRLWFFLGGWTEYKYKDGEEIEDVGGMWVVAINPSRQTFWVASQNQSDSK